MSDRSPDNATNCSDDRLVSVLDNLIRLATNCFLYIGAVGVVILMLLTVVGVFWRYVLNDPIVGIDDLSVITLIIVAACAVAYGATNQAHVSVSVIKSFFGRSVTRYTDLIMRLASIFVTGLATFALYSRACGFEKACITTNLSIEHWPYYYVLAVGMLFFTIVLMVHFVIGLRYFSGVDPNEPPE